MKNLNDLIEKVNFKPTHLMSSRRYAASFLQSANDVKNKDFNGDYKEEQKEEEDEEDEENYNDIDDSIVPEKAN